MKRVGIGHGEILETGSRGSGKHETRGVRSGHWIVHGAGIGDVDNIVVDGGRIVKEGSYNSICG